MNSETSEEKEKRVCNPETETAAGPLGPNPGAPLTNFNDGGGGGNKGLYFIPKKITTLEFVYPKKSLLFLAYPQKIP